MENSAAKMEKPALPVVAIDGVKIKTIRETKKLTQLYVASVVGVTTDTISRWENNRYPAIKRDNADKLASALEVELAEILRQETSEETPGEEVSPPARKSRRRLLLPLIVASILLLVAGGVFFSRRAVAVPMAERKLPSFGAPGELIPVQVKINGSNTASAGLILKERLPTGWRLVSAVPAAVTGQADSEEVKWLIPSGNEQSTISYTVRISPTAVLQTTATFTGEVVSHIDNIARRGACGGDQTMKVAGIHWADRNGDGRIDDDEIMPAYYLTEIKGLGLDWKSTEAIWSGKGYRWDPLTKNFPVIK